MEEDRRRAKKDEKTRREKQRERDRLEELQLRPGEVPLPPMPTHRPDSFVPIIERLRPEVLQQLRQAQAGGGGGAGGGRGFIPGKAGVDYPDFKTIPATDFTCENFLLPGFYADTFTSCQVFHVCEEGRRQSSFLCPRGTIFNQEFRVCDWWYNVKCENSAEYFDRNLDLMIQDQQRNSLSSSSSSSSLGLDLSNLVEDGPSLGPFSSKVDFGLLASELGLSDTSGSLLDSLDYLDLTSLGLGGGESSDLDLEELTNEVDGLETLAKEMETLVRLNNGGRTREKLTKTRDERPDRPKGGKRKKKQAKRPKAQRKSGKVSGSSSGGGGGSSVTLCQLMNICDTIPMGSRTVEGKFGPPHGDVPFASSKRSELVVEAPSSKTSNSSSPEKKSRMEESEFKEEEGEVTKHREIEFSQGLPVRGSERNRGVIQPRNTKVEDLKRPGSQQTDASLPISFIDFDYQPSAPLSGRVAKVSSALSSGNLYENMARQLEAFLEGQESRHPKMVEAMISNQTHVMVGGEAEDNLNLDTEEVLVKSERNNSLEPGDTLVSEFQVAVGTPISGTPLQDDEPRNSVQNLKDRKARHEVESNSLPTMEIETHNEDGSKHSQRVYANGWTPLVIGSVPGIAPREQTTFMARMLDFSTSTSRSTSFTSSSTPSLNSSPSKSSWRATNGPQHSRDE